MKRLFNIFKKHSSNASGFTLVELMVATIALGILMTGAFAFMKPASDNYRDTGEYTNLHGATSAISDYLTGHLRYATDILVLEGYEGSPVTNADSLAGTKYTHYFILDNNRVLAPSDTAAYRKNCTGRILRSAMGLSGVNVNCGVILGEGIYGDYYYHFDVEPYETGLKIDIAAYPAKKSVTGDYIKDTDSKFETEITIESLNIRNDITKKVKYYDFVNSPNYTLFPKVSNSDTTRYTYIFYTMP